MNELKCAYCGAAWRHLQPTNIQCTIGRKCGYLKYKFDINEWNKLTIQQQEEIQIWRGPSQIQIWREPSANMLDKNNKLIKRKKKNQIQTGPSGLLDINEWKKLVERRGGNIVFSGRTAYLNVQNSLFTYDTNLDKGIKENVKWLLEHGANLDKGVKENYRFLNDSSSLLLKYSKDKIFDLFAHHNGVVISNDQMKNIIEHRLWEGYSPNLSRAMYEVSRINKKQKTTKIGKYYLCRDILNRLTHFSVNFDGSYPEEEIKKSFYYTPAISIRPVIVLDEAIGYDGQLCIRIRYLHGISSWASCYDEVFYFFFLILFFTNIFLFLV